MLRYFLFVVLIMVSFPDYSTTQTWTTYTTENSALVNNRVRAISIDSYGALWFGTDNGLSRFDGTIWTTYTTEDNLVHNTINDIVFEETVHGPEIWIATDGGISVVSVIPDAITFDTPYTTENTSLLSNTVYAAEIDSNHIKWFGTDSGVSSFDGHIWINYTTETILTSNRVMSIGAGHTDQLYYGTEGGGVSRFDGVSSASSYDTDWGGIASDNVYAIFVDDENIQWFGTDKGVSRHVGDDNLVNWTTYTTENGLAHNFIHAIAEDRKGLKWFGTDGGVSSFDGTTLRTYTTHEGLAGTSVYSIAVDLDGSLWFGTNTGVSRYSDIDVGVETPNPVQPAAGINGIFPNPFNTTTTIEFTISKAGFNKLFIYNSLGQKVCELVDYHLAKGTYSVQWNGHDTYGNSLPSGIYFTCLLMGSHESTGRMVLLK